MNKSSSEPKRIQFLDSLRGYAALWVVAVHVCMMPSPNFILPEWFGVFIKNGTMGVELFFVVSAFSLCLSMPGHAKEERPILGFALRRFFRIAPLFYIFVIISSFFNPAGVEYSYKTILANLFFVFNLFPGSGYQTSVVLSGWTIGVEMMFYLIFPFVYYRVNNVFDSLTAFFFSIFIWSFLYSILHLFLSDPGTYNMYSIVFRLPVFMSGLIAFYALNLFNNKNYNSSFNKSIGLLFLSLVPVLFFAIVQNNTNFIYNYHWTGVMFACLVIGLGLNPVSFVVNKISIWLGKISYSIYLVHGPVVVLLSPIYIKMQNSGFNSVFIYILAFLATAIVSVCVSILTYNFIEKPSNDWGRNIASRLAGRR
ncbi:acyltransferase [Pseudochrobactrum sp. AO18b]|uniref:acyltransferase family protein n=1 Tax=Pseudochrobactrum sp. AO18b TaxID=1201036 RepID=UPI0005250DDC|nr:acyltransferase [Pseudochrobactrum sp. AO18b]